ncbi:hypothetical protein D3C85_396310 [compost metagenome]
MTNTMHTSVNTEPGEKRTEIPSLAEADLREYFAAKATKEDVQEMRYLHASRYQGGEEFKPLGWVEAKYAYADAMLAARGDQ